MSKFLSGRQSNLKLGVAGYTENKTVLETTGKVGIGTTDAQSYSLYVVGDANITGLVSATSFYGDGSNLENTGATLSAAAGTQRLVVTSLTSGTMVDAATDSDLTFNATTNTLNTDNLIVAGNLTVSGDQTILNTTQLEVEDINIGIASASSKLNDAQLDGAGITIHGSQGDKTLTWSNANSRMEFNTTLYASRYVGVATDNVIPFLYNDYTNLPSAGTYHGAFAHVHNTQKAYFAHANAWYELVNKELNGIVGTGTESYNINNVQINGGISTDGTSYGLDGQLLKSTGTGWEWRTVPGIFSVNNILNGFNVLEEGGQVGTAGSIHTLDFRGINVFASGDPQPNGIATITFTPTPTFTGVNLTGVSTITGTITAGSSEGVVGQYLRHVGTGVTWASFPQLRVTQTNTANAGQTTFNFSYNVNFLDVFVNGVKLTSSEYSANNGSQIVLNTPAFAGEIVEFHSYNVASTYGAGSGGGASNLTGLSDVNFPIALADDQLLQFNSSTNVWENVPVTSLPYATEAFVGLATAGLANEALVGLSTAGLASESYVNTQVGLATAGLASEAFVGLSTAGLLTAHQSLIGKANVTIGDNPPGIGTASGDLWWESDTAKGHIYYDDGSSAQWVEFNPSSGGGGGGGGGGSYANSDVDNHLNTGTASSGEVLSWNGSDYDWVAQSGGGSGISLTDLSVTTANTPLQLGALAYNNSNGVFTFTPPDIVGQARPGFSVGPANNPLQVGAISYASTSGVFTYTPPDLSSYLTSYTETDPVVGAVNGIVKANGSGTISAATAGTDYLTPTGNGSGLTNLSAGNLTGTLPAIDGSALTNLPTTHSDIVSVWTLGASGSSHYTFTGPGLTGAENDPTIYLVRGQTYRFTNNSGGSHPFQIRYNSNGTAYSDGVTNNGASSGNIDFNVQYDAPDVLYYQCTNHSGMLGKIIILGDVVNEGSWTASAGTAQTIDTITGVANNAIKTAEYVIHIENGSNMQAQKVLVMQDGTTAYSQEYAIMHKSGLLVSISATISGGNLLLQATPETGVSGTTTYKVTRQTMR